MPRLRVEDGGVQVHKRHPLRRHFRARPRLFASVAIGLAVALLVPGGVSPTLRAIIGWDCGIVLFLGLAITMAARATEASMRHRAALEDEARWVFLALVAGAAFFSMFAILVLAHGILSFLFNTVVLALSINLFAGFF